MSRTDARSTALRHRPARTVPATIVAFILVLLGIGLVWVAVLRLTNGTWPSFLGSVSSWLTSLTWGATLALAIAVAVVVIGLVLLIAALAPGKPNAMTIHHEPEAQNSIAQDTTEKTEYVMTRRSVAKLAAAHADLVDGVDKVSVTTNARQVKLRVKTASEQTNDIQHKVTDRVRDALTATGLKPVPRVSTIARTTKP